MFRQDQAYAGILTTLNHTKAMHREWGYPVAPEAWEENHLAWGSRYYNWDLAHVLPIIEWLAGLDYSIPDQQFTFAPHLPSTWDFIETYTPVVIDDETKWVHARVDRTQTEDAVQLVASVSGNPLMETIVAPYTEDRAVLETTGEGEESTFANAIQFLTAQVTNTVKLVLGEKLKTYKTLVWSTPRTRIFHGSVTVDVENLLPGTVLRYTTDGSEPTDTSPLWEGQVQVTSTTSYKLRAYSENGSTYEPYEMVYEATELKPADTDPTNTKPGMFYRYYELEGKHTSLPDFESLQPTKTGTLTPDQFNQHINVEAIAGDRKENYALHLTSYLSVPENEVYHFHLHADDGARIVIDGQTVVDLDTHSYVDAWEAEGSIGLQEGLHRVDLFYYQDGFRTRLTVKSRKGDEASYEYITPESWQMPTD